MIYYYLEKTIENNIIVSNILNNNFTKYKNDKIERKNI